MDIDRHPEFKRGELHRRDLKANPIEQFAVWFKQANNGEILEPTAMSLATAGADGRPLARTVLLKSYDDGGFVFYTNFESRKAHQMQENPSVCLLFPWLAQERQVIIIGAARKLSTAESLSYFATRPRGSQLGAWVSRQSSVITTRAMLEMQWEEMKRKFSAGEVPLPSWWGGYRVKPQEIEFWQGRQNRLHDRFLYTRQPNEGWTIARLAP